MFVNNLVMYALLFCLFVCFLLRVFCALYSSVYSFSFVYSCLFPTFVQVYRPMPPGGNPIAVNKYITYYHRIVQYVTLSLKQLRVKQTIADRNCRYEYRDKYRSIWCNFQNL